jgi:hypothetical protein
MNKGDHMFETAKKIIEDSGLLETSADKKVFSMPYLEEVDEDTVIYHVGEYKYQAQNITKSNYGIRAVIEMHFKKELVNKNLVSLYSSRARMEFVNKLKNVDTKTIERHLLSLETELRMFMERKVKNKLIRDKQKAPDMTDEERKEALDFLMTPDLFKTIEKDIESIGYVGENTNKLLVYLIATSRKLDNPMSCIIKAQSSSGKSQLMKAVVSLMPPEQVFDVSRITENALFWLEGTDLKHKLMTIAEREGSDGANYSIRLLQSEKKLKMLTPQKNSDDEMKTTAIEIEGPVAIVETTTSTSLEVDNQTRVFEIYIDESEEQTKLIQYAQKRSRTLEGMLAKRVAEKIVAKHQNAQRLLEPLKVMIPFAEYIEFPSKMTRTRRDCERFLELITAITFLRQYQKTVKEDPIIGRYIEAELTDYELAYNLAVKVLAQNLDELDKRSRELLNHIIEMVNEMSEQNDSVPDITFTRRELLSYLKTKGINLYPQILHTYIAPLEAEYLEVISGGKGRTSIYKLNLTINEEGKIQMPSLLKSLTTPDQLRAKIAPSKPKSAPKSSQAPKEP